MSGARYVLGDGVAVLGADSAPNAVAPAAGRRFVLENPQSTAYAVAVSDAVFLTAKDGAPTVTIWARVRGTTPRNIGGATPQAYDRWADASAEFGGPAFVVAQDVIVRGTSAHSVPMNCELFLQVVAPNGATAIAVGTVQQ